jgi:hypothetical protein
MELDFACPCGATLRVSADDAGLPVCCPACSRDVTAPGASLRPWNRGERGTLLDHPGPQASEPENPLAFTEPGQLARARARVVQAEEDANRTVEGAIADSGMVGGALAMLIGAGLLALGFSVGGFHPFTVILFVVGFIAFVRGAFVKPRKKYR